MCKKELNVAIYDFIFDGLNILSKYTKVPINTIINNWLYMGTTKHYTEFSKFVFNLKEIEESEKFKNIPESEVKKWLSPTFQNFTNKMAKYFLETDKSLKEFAIRNERLESIALIHEYPTASDWRDEEKFRQSYFEFVERFNNALRQVSSILGRNVESDFADEIWYAFCKKVNIQPVDLESVSKEDLDRISQLTEESIVLILMKINPSDN